MILQGELILDENVWKGAAEYICRRAPDVVGFSSRCDNYLHSLRIAAELRQMRPQVPIIFGGPQATITDAATLNRFEFIDYVVRHEAEHFLPVLLEALGASRGWNTFPELFAGAMGRLCNPQPLIENRPGEARRRFI